MRCAYCALYLITSRRKVEHEATTSRISEDQLFCCLQRGLDEEDAVSLIVNGFCSNERTANGICSRSPEINWYYLKAQLAR